MKDGFQNYCDECGGVISWKIERRTEILEEWIGICISCGAFYSGSYTTG